MTVWDVGAICEPAVTHAAGTQGRGPRGIVLLSLFRVAKAAARQGEVAWSQSILLSSVVSEDVYRRDQKAGGRMRSVIRRDMPTFRVSCFCEK